MSILKREIFFFSIYVCVLFFSPKCTAVVGIQRKLSSKPNSKLKSSNHSEHDQKIDLEQKRQRLVQLHEVPASEQGTQSQPFHRGVKHYSIVLGITKWQYDLLTYFTSMKVATESSKTMCWRTDSRDAPGICPIRWTGLGTDVSNFFKSRTCCPMFLVVNILFFPFLSPLTKVLYLMHKICKFLKHHFAL